MEFHEKLQKLRKDRGLTQEELAEALYVSRTAISKWESGRGYPSIDSLKEISHYFCVSIDDLLSGDTLITIAKKENDNNISHLCQLLFGTTDLFSVILIVLPLYPDTFNDFIYSVNLFQYNDINSSNYIIYWMMYLSLITLGIVNILSLCSNKNKFRNIITYISIILSVLLVLYLSLTRETYAIVVTFLLLIIKTLLLLKYMKK